jgi:hypothetical protein
MLTRLPAIAPTAGLLDYAAPYFTYFNTGFALTVASKTQMVPFL